MVTYVTNQNDYRRNRGVYNSYESKNSNQYIRTGIFETYLLFNQKA